MAIPTKSLEEMIRDVIASLQAGTRGGRPVYALLLGSGFSYPIVPTPTQMLRSDIAWWRFCKDRRGDGPFRNRAEAVAEGMATAEEIAGFEKELWKMPRWRSTNGCCPRIRKRSFARRSVTWRRK